MKTALIASSMLLLLACKGEIKVTNPVNGLDGQDGYNSLILMERFDSDLSLCKAEKGLLISSGLDLNRDEVLNSEEITTYSIVCDGLDGIDGLNGINGLSGQNGTNGQNGKDAVLEIINPCHRPANSHNEIFLRLPDGNVVCSFSDDYQGDNTHLALLYAGSFVTTDGYACYFNIDSDLTITDQDGNVWTK